MRDLANEMDIALDYSLVSREEWNQACSVSGVHGKLFERQIFMPAPSDDTKIKSAFKKIARKLKQEQKDVDSPPEVSPPSGPGTRHKL